MHICAVDFVFLGSGGLQDEHALHEEQGRGGIEQRVVGEEDEVVLENGSPDERGQDPYSCLGEDGCESGNGAPWSVLVCIAFGPAEIGGWMGSGTKKGKGCLGVSLCSLPVPVTKLNCSPCPGLCVTSPGRPRRGSSSCKAGFCSGMPVADAIAVVAAAAVATCSNRPDGGSGLVYLFYFRCDGEDTERRRRDDCARVARYFIYLIIISVG